MTISLVIRVLEKNIDEFRPHEEREINGLIEKFNSGDLDSDDEDKLREYADRL
jgi:hypothetical protein